MRRQGGCYSQAKGDNNAPPVNQACNDQKEDCERVGAGDYTAKEPASSGLTLEMMREGAQDAGVYWKCSEQATQLRSYEGSDACQTHYEGCYHEHTQQYLPLGWILYDAHMLIGR